jgi:uncharacterized protein (TIGR02099 family)
LHGAARRRSTRFVKRTVLWAWRVAAASAVTLVLLTASVVLLLRFWFLPNIDQYRPEIAQAISRAADQRISIGRLEADWRQWRPRLTLRDVRLYDGAGAERLALAAVAGELSWVSVVAFEPRFHTIEVERLALEVRRASDGSLSIAGIALAGGPTGRQSNLADWLLEQHRLILRDSELTWIDETLGGAPLVLRDVEATLQKGFQRHRFTLRAVPGLEVAAPLAARGELAMPSFRHLDRWRGKVYFEVGYADLAGLGQWVRMPVAVSRGAGALQIWVEIANGAANAVTADVALSDVEAALRTDLPALQLERLRGRLGWKTAPNAFELWTEGLSFTTSDGASMSPSRIRYRRAGALDAPSQRSELTLDTLDLEAFTHALDSLPLPAALRTRVAEMAPHGLLREFRLVWEGPWTEPRAYAVRARFEALALRPSGYIPGFTGADGELDSDQSGGTLRVAARDAIVDAPHVFLDPLPLDTLTANVAWTIEAGLPKVRLENFEFANAHLASRANGTYEAAREGPGSIDLSGVLARIDGPNAWRYIPLQVRPAVRNWLQRAILAGSVSEARVRLKGDLRDFPYRDGTNGVFEVIAPVRDGVIDYAPGWPRLESVTGQLAFRGDRMDITGEHGRIANVSFSSARVWVPELSSRDPLLHVQTEADGTAGELLNFIEQSPVDRMLHGFTRGMRADGQVRLSLSFDLPLDHAVDTQVNGRLRFAENTLFVSPTMPPIEQLSGELAFTESQVSMRDGTGRVYGVPMRLGVEPDERGGVRIRASGRADVSALRRHFDHPALASLSGAADWRAMVTWRDQRYTLALESDLVGVQSSLPDPLAKAAPAALGLRLERRELAAQQEAWTLALGNVLSGEFLLERAPAARLRRGAIALGARVELPRQDGLWFTARLDRLDLDRWRAIVAVPKSERDGAILSGVQLRVAALTVFSREFREVALDAIRQDAQWEASIASREATGKITWTSLPADKLMGRFSRLHIPDATALPQVTASNTQVRPVADLPELDLIAEDLRVGQRQLGRLTLRAAPRGPDWRIERAETRSPEGSIVLDGVWHRNAPIPRTQIAAHVESPDVGKYFARLDLPQGIRGATGDMQVQLSWDGPPYSVDLPTASGVVRFGARRGQFVKMEPGLSKLIGVVSLQALPRRVQLDFRDVFGEGFTFDSITATATVDRGIARTRDFRMVGTAARVEMFGEVDLMAETQRLDVKVMPSMSESIALGAAIVNPAVGLATWLAQKALQDPIDKIAAFEYEVTGTWDDPLVASKRRAAPSDAPQGRK